MNITISKVDAPGSISILRLQGKLDGANYESLLEEARNAYEGGVRNLILDLSGLTFISSAGVASLHQVAILFRGQELPRLQLGWDAYHAIDRDRSNGTERHVKLFSPTPEVQKVLELIGFEKLFETYTDLPSAVASFRSGGVPINALLA